jgi:Na+-transporting NADH:ubiquinone oxidoreductase subunit NqrC
MSENTESLMMLLLLIFLVAGVVVVTIAIILSYMESYEKEVQNKNR